MAFFPIYFAYLQISTTHLCGVVSGKQLHTYVEQSPDIKTALTFDLRLKKWASKCWKHLEALNSLNHPAQG